MSNKLMFEDLKNLKCGDQIIMNDPLLKEDTPYVLMSNINYKDYYFVSGYGGSLIIKDQETIDAFKVKYIDNTHPSWDSDLAEHGKQMGLIMDELTSMNVT